MILEDTVTLEYAIRTASTVWSMAINNNLINQLTASNNERRVYQNLLFFNQFKSILPKTINILIMLGRNWVN